MYRKIKPIIKVITFNITLIRCNLSNVFLPSSPLSLELLIKGISFRLIIDRIIIEASIRISPSSIMIIKPLKTIIMILRIPITIPKK